MSHDEFEARCCGIPCLVRVTYWEPYRPACVDGPPEYCYPAEGGQGDWELLDVRGRRAVWLERKLDGNRSEERRLAREVFNFMEGRA